MSTFNLNGIPGDSPTPTTAREFRYAQGSSTGAGNQRKVVIVGNKTSDGTEPLETLGSVILSDLDAQQRCGNRSELLWTIKAYKSVDPTAPMYIMAVAEGASATASTCTFTFATNADKVTTVNIDWGGLRYQVSVAVGDTPTIIALVVKNKINADPFLPFTAGVSAGVVTLTAANLGPRGDNILGRVRMSFSDATVATTIVKSALTSGTVSDSVANAIAALATDEFAYHIISATSLIAVTATDGGVGQYIQSIASGNLPINGKDQTVHIGLVGTQAQGTTVSTSASANNVLAKFYRAKNNDLPPHMIAAIGAAAERSQEMIHPGANINGYPNAPGMAPGAPFPIPDPFTKTDRPTAVEIAADLNNGICPIAFSTTGTPYLVRSVTSYSWIGSSATNDYRAREGHIPSVMAYAWGLVRDRYNAQRQPFTATDVPAGQRPLAGVMYVSTMKGIVGGVISELCGPAVNNMPVLDPDANARMLDSIAVSVLPDGFGVDVTFEPVRHDNKGLFRLNQAGPAY